MVNLSLHATTYQVAQRDPKASDDGPGSLEQPWKTLSKSAAQAGPGDIVLIGTGLYREQVLLRTSGTAEKPIRFEAAPGAFVVLTGADSLTNWQKVEGDRKIYSTAWPHRFGSSPNMAHPDDDLHRLIGRCEQVIVDGYLLHQVLEPGQLSRGTFWVDITNQVLQVWDQADRDLSTTGNRRVLVEGSARQEILRVSGDYVEVRGLRFRFAANPAQQGAVALAGAHDLLEDCVIEQMNGGGAKFSREQQTVRRCIFRDNGQLGFSASGAHDLLFTECLVENNNTKGFNRGWEAGGDKFWLCRNAVLERSQFVRNRGCGIWFDNGNDHCTVRQCLVADNEDAGIVSEISLGLQALDNVIVGNGFAETAGAWAIQAGISISSSPDCVIERNLILGNREGFAFREQTRTTSRIGMSGQVPIWNQDEVIQHNIIAYNRDGQIRGWFDVRDNRHWPASGTNQVAGAGAVAKSGEPGSQPQGLTLEDLRLRFADNVYFAAPGQEFVVWGTTWGRHKSYPSLDDFQTDLRIDTGSKVLDPGFSDMLTRDYRLSRQVMDKLTQNYPHGPVPECVLGVE
jgi:hypothetical protein